MIEFVCSDAYDPTEFVQIVRFPNPHYCECLGKDSPFGFQVTSEPSGRGRLIAVCDLDGEKFQPRDWEFADEVPSEVVEIVAQSLGLKGPRVCE